MEPIHHEHKKELHERVTERCTQLKTTLQRLQTDAHDAKSERARAIEGALAAVETHLSGGWEAIGATETAELARWIESSRFLFDEPAVLPAPAPVADESTKS